VEFHLPLSALPDERAFLKEGITTLLRNVAGIMLSQKTAVESFENTLAAKRARTNSEGGSIQAQE